MATASYNPKEAVTVTLSYGEILTLKRLVCEAVEYARIRLDPEHYRPAVDAVNAIVAAVYPDHPPVELRPLKRSEPAAEAA